jgi:small subunit ribosomal protein S2
MANSLPTITDLFKAGAHFGHRRNHTDARSHEYVFSYRNRVAVINLEKTAEQIQKALEEIAVIAAKGGSFLFVGTKLQAKELVRKAAEETGSTYIVERWPGGLLTNYDVIIKGIKKMNKTEEDLAENKLTHLKKKEVLKIEKDLAKQKTIFGGLKTLDGKPDLIIVVDAKQEDIAVAEARNQGVPIVGICDTNSNPRIIDFPIVANDDSRKTIELILNQIVGAIKSNFKPKAEPVTEEKIEKRIEQVAKEEVAIEKAVEKKVVAATDKKVSSTAKPKLKVKSAKAKK